MKKQLKRIVAIVAAIAMTVTGMTFTPAVKVDASTSKISVTGVPSTAGGKKSKYRLGTTSDTSADGKWYLEVSNNQWANWTGSYQNADGIEDFTFYNEVYNNRGGIFLWSSDLKSEFNLTNNTDYEMSVTIDYSGVNAAQHNYILTEGGTANMSESRTVAAGTSQETYTADVSTGGANDDLVLRISWTSASYETAEKATIKVTDVTFTEKGTPAPGTGNCTIGVADQSANGGIWTYTVLQNDYNNMEASYTGADAVDGFEYIHKKYSYQGSYWKTSDLKDSSLYDLTPGTPYDMTVSITPTCTQATSINVKTIGGTVNLPNSSQSGTASGGALTFTGEVTPGSGDFRLCINYGNDGADQGLNAYEGGFVVNSVTFVEAETTTPAPGSGVCTIGASDQSADGGIWTYTVLDNDGHTQTANYSGATGVEGFTYNQNEYSWQGAYWKTTELKDEFSLVVGSTYNMSVTLEPTCDTDTDITVSTSGGKQDMAADTQSGSDGDELTYTGTVKVSGADLVLNIGYGNDGADQGLEAQAGGFTVSDVTFTEVDSDFIKQPTGDNQNVTGSSVWKTSVNYDGVNSYGDLRTKAASGSAYDPANITFKMVGGISKAETYGDPPPQGKTTGDRVIEPENRYWYMSADLTGNYLITLDTESGKNSNTTGGINDTLTQDKKYNISIDYTSTAATVDPDEHGYAAKLFVTPEGGTEEEFDLVAGSGTLELDQEVVYNGTSENLKFLFDELTEDSKFTVTGVTFTEIDDGWVKVPINVEGGTQPEDNSPWRLISNNDSGDDPQPENPTWGNSWYKIYDDAVHNVARIHLKKEYADTGVENEWNWDMAKYTVSTTEDPNCTLVPKHHYTGQIVIKSTAGTNTGKVLGLEVFGETYDTALNSNGTTTVNISDFKYDPSATDILLRFAELPQSAEFYIDSITFTNNDDGWTKVTTVEEGATTGVIPETNSPWTLFSTADGAEVNPTNGDSWYKIDNSVSGVSRVHLKKDYTDAGMNNDWYWDYARLAINPSDFSTTLVNKHHYTGTIRVHSSAATASGKKLRIVGFGQTIEASLVNGSVDIPIADFKYDATNHTNLEFVFVEIPQNAEFYVESVTFTNNDDGWTKVTTVEEGATTGVVPETNSPWTLTSTNNSATVQTGASNGDSWYKLDTTSGVSALSKVHLKKEYTDGTNQNSWNWDTAKLAGYGTSYGLVTGDTYTGSIVVNSSAATTSGHKLTVSVFGTTYDVPLSAGDTTITINQFKHNAAASDDIVFSYVELPENAEWYVKSITFNQVDADYTKQTVGSDVNVPNTNWRTSINNDGASSYGDIRYKVDSSKDSNDPANTSFKMAGSIGEAEVYGDNPPAGKQTGDRIDNPTDRWWWMSAELYGNYKATVIYADSTTATGDINNILRSNKRYSAEIVVNSTAATVNPDEHGYAAKLFVTPFGGSEEEFSLSVGDNTLQLAGELTYTGGSSANIKFLFDELTQDSKVSVKSITFTEIDDGFEPVPANEDFTPEDSQHEPITPWVLRANNNGTDAHGQMEYKVEGSDPTDYSNTTIRLVNTVAQPYPEGERWYWTTGKLPGINSGLSMGLPYTGSITFNISEEPAAGTKLYVWVDGVEYPFTVHQGENILEFSEFTYMGNNPDITFNFDEMPKGAEVSVSDIDFDTEGDWDQVPDEQLDNDYVKAYSYKFREKDGSLDTTVSGTHTWNVFAGKWNTGSTINGCILYHDRNATATEEPKIKIGPGVRWDPACAQIKINNADAYQNLTPYNSYYMTLKFKSTDEGIIHITQEGYEPKEADRFEVTTDDEGWNYYRKKMTYYPNQDSLNILMSLTGTTYEYDENGDPVMEDGSPKIIPADIDNALPIGTVLSDFSLEFQKTDEDIYTLVNDCRFEQKQDYTPIISSGGQDILLGYTNSYYNSWMSYRTNVHTENEDAIAKTSIRLDSTYGTFPGLEEQWQPWPNHLRIPNSYFYDRTDTDGHALVEGKTYKLRFYYNVNLEDAESQTIGTNKGMVMVRQGYDDWIPRRYVSNSGLNMANGTITAKSGYNSHSDESYDKSGGIDFTYNPYATIGTEYVQFDFSEIPTGAEISDISWEFWAPKYDVYIDGTKNTTDPIMEGDTYTFPTNQTQGFENVVKYVYTDPDTGATTDYLPGATVPFATFNDVIQGDLYVTAVRNHTVTIVDNDNPQTVITTGQVQTGNNYTLPTISGVEYYTYNNVDYDPGDSIGPIESDETVYAHLAQNTHTVIILDTNGDPVRTTVVEDNAQYTFPSGGDYADVKQFVGVDGTQGSYEQGDVIEHVTSDMTFQMDMYDYYTIYINDEEYDTVREGQQFTFPDNDEYPGATGFVDTDDNPYGLEETITPTEDIEAYSVQVVTIQNPDGTTHATFPTTWGENFTFPTNQDQGYENVARFDGVAPTTGQYQPGATTDDPVTSNLTFRMVMNVVTYEWRVDGVKQADVEAGTEITLPSTATIGYLLEYLDGQDQGVTNDLYKPSDKYVVNRNVNFISINSVTVEAKSGAAMRFEGNEGESKKDLRGIAFSAKLLINGGEAPATAINSDAFQTGIIITPYDAFTDVFDEDLTIEAALADETHSAVIIDNTGKGNQKWMEGAPGEYRCGITHMKDANISRDFVARGYTTITYKDGTTYDTQYADNPSSTTKRSIHQIATLIYTEHYDYYLTLPKAWQEMVDECMKY